MQIDQVREYWDRQPCNVYHSQLPRGTAGYFQAVRDKKFRAEPHIPAFCEFERWRGARVLEIGCGIGTMAAEFARAGADYTGVELSGESLALAQQRFDVYQLPGKFYLGNAEELNDFLPPQKFDLIFSWGVIHHTPRPQAVLSQIRQYLTAGSWLKIMVYASHSWKNIMIGAGIDQPEAQAGCPVAYTYTRSELLDLVGTGFDSVELTQDHIFCWQLDPYRQGQFVQQPWFAAMPPTMFTALERELGWHLMYTGRKT